ncbi:hypothetical protein ROHU_021653 [Labeo rohita]|uniref:Uncharacterized protein n=1 Tax=Labeo rohita TaxID=84645 RepID=A0A498L3D4_LABRO|nr:hypothetical protein ROHU_034774 [Labeo rohita]RXN25213.1 hypothetical protein ROHU_021653 [Labeo rohita]
MTMKQLYKRIMELEGHETTHILVFLDEAGFNLSKGRRRDRNLIGHRATTDTPGQLLDLHQYYRPSQSDGGPPAIPTGIEKDQGHDQLILCGRTSTSSLLTEPPP